MHRRPRGETLSERLRAEVQVSAALWQIGPRTDGNAASGDAESGSQRPPNANDGSSWYSFPCPREVKPLLFFYKYLQPAGGAESGGNNDNSGNPPTKNHSQRKLRVNLPLTVICERTNAQESVLWVRTDAQGNVIREDKTPLWRKKLHNELMSVASDSNESDPVLAVRSVARWKSSNYSSGGSAVVLTTRTLDPILAVPCELPTCIQQFVHCRGSQASVYRVFWCQQERKCFAVNLTSSLKSTEAPEDAEIMNNPSVTSPSGLSASTMAAMNAAFEAAMTTAAQTARFYCVTVSPDARACARWPKLRGAAIAEGVQATSRVVEHVQMQLPSLRFHSMTADFIKDTSGVWWLTRVVDFQASSSIEPPRDDAFFGTRDSAVCIPEALRTRYGPNNESQVGDPASPPKESLLLRGDELSNTMNTRSCFLCGCSCELTRTFRGQLEAMVKGYSGDEYKTNSSISMKTPAVDEFRMTLTMALDTIFLVRQRGVSLPVWENAVSTVRKSQLRDVCDFPTCMLCYRIYQQQNRLQLLARELHCILSPNVVNPCDSPEVDSESTPTDGVGMATSAASGLASQLLSTELRYNQEAPKDVLDSLEAFQIEKIPPSLLLRGDSPELRPTGSTLTPMRGADVDPTATQLRLVFFFHELQDGGPDLDPTDFYLEYQLGQNVTRVQLEGSKRHTPNRWQLCEARVHYLCATLEAFSEFCSQKRLLIKLKAKPRSQSDDSDNEDSAANNEEEGQSPTGKPSRYRDKEEFFGYTLLSLRAVNTAAKWFGNSLQPESRTDYLLELQTASYGLLTLKVTVGLLVDSVPLGHLRDVFRGRIFLEEQPPDGSIAQRHGDTLTADIGDFRTKILALVVCELFEQMESLDDGYIEIAELRSLAKCFPEQEYLCVELDTDVGTRERLTQEDIVVLAQLVDQQRRLALRTLLRSLMGSSVMVDALARFDRVGSGEMSLEKFRELAFEALISQRKVFRAFHEEPKKPHDGFCLRHGFTEIYVTDGVCVLCTAEYQAEKSTSKPERSPGSPQPTHTDNGTIVDAARFNGKRTLSGRSVDADFYSEGKQNLDPENVRRASTPTGFRRLSTDKRALDVPAVGPRRRRAVSGKTVTAQQVVDLELEGVLNRLHAAERTIVTGEAHANERKASVASVRTRQSSATTEDTSMSHTSPGSDLGGLARIPRRKSTKTPQISCQDDSTGPDKAAKKKRMKKRILKKTARRVRSANSLPTSDSLSKLLRMEFSDRVLSTSASESIIEKAVRIEQRRKELDRLVLAEVQEVKQRLAKLLDES
ncbi:hypothetical protein PC119_g11749 [Phytophthora cactorum]|nr:hypothetical protein PC119_g11749 [Phytophthora cactorum]KAG3136622.1 hypothetical protein C6341_g21316 [Phytophthora cactorum]